MRSAALAGLVVAMGVWMIMSLAGCDGTPASDRAFWRPWYERQPVSTGEEPTETDSSTSTDTNTGTDTGTSTSTSTDTDTANPTACGLSVAVTTASFGGAYAPNNIGSIWIADERDRFVKTLTVWADRRREHLDRWVAATAAAGLPNSRLDAVSTATKTSHGARSARWDCTDTSHAVVADGNYRVCFELTESNGAGPLDCVAFAKGPSALDLAPDDRPTFKKRRVVFTP